MAVEASTFTGSDLDHMMTAMLQSLRDDTPSMTQVFNRGLETDMRNNEFATVDVIMTEEDGGSPNTLIVRDRSSDLAADYLSSLKEFDVGQIRVEINKGGENGFSIKRRDIRRAPARSRARIAAMNRQMMNNALLSREKGVIDYMSALDTYTTEVPATADKPNRSNTGSNNNAGKIYSKTIGSNSGANYAALSSVNGAPIQKGTSDFVDVFMTGLEDLCLRLLETNVTDGMSIAGTMGDTVTLWVPHRVVRGMQTGLRRKNLYGDNLTANLYMSARAFGMGMRKEELADINVVGTKAIANPTTATGGYTGFLMTGNAIYYGEADVESWSEAPTSEGGIVPGPRYHYRQAWEYGYGLINSDQLIKVNFASVAP